MKFIFLAEKKSLYLAPIVENYLQPMVKDQENGGLLKRPSWESKATLQLALKELKAILWLALANKGSKWCKYYTCI